MFPFQKNFQKLLVFFFAAGALVLVVMGINRSKSNTVATTPTTPDQTATGATSTNPAPSQGGATFSGKTYQTPWGNVVASISVANGKITGVTMPQVPDSPPSQYAQSYLVAQALAAGSANIQGVSGATYTSIAFKSSLESAIALANSTATTNGESSVASSPSAITPVATPTSVPRRYHRDSWDD